MYQVPIVCQELCQVLGYNSEQDDMIPALIKLT